MRLARLIDEVEAQAPLADSPLHGSAHWRCVALTALRLCRCVPGADPEVALLFGLFHDARRENEDADPEHGARAAELALELHGDAFLLRPDALARLLQACREHTEARRVTHPTLAVCLDADRLNLPRCGISPRAEYLSTEKARTDAEFAGWAAGLHAAPPTWDHVVAVYARQLRPAEPPGEGDGPSPTPTIRTLRTTPETDPRPAA